MRTQNNYYSLKWWIGYTVSTSALTLIGDCPITGFWKHPTLSRQSCSATSGHLWSMWRARVQGVSQIKRGGGYFRLRYRSAASRTDFCRRRNFDATVHCKQKGSVERIIFHSQCSAGLLLFLFVLHALFSSQKCLQEIISNPPPPPEKRLAPIRPVMCISFLKWSCYNVCSSVNIMKYQVTFLKKKNDIFYFPRSLVLSHL